MQTNFSLAQLADPKTAEAESILRRCVHCGFCLATCPTYLELGNELDSPRGRIYLIKDMLENDKPASTEVATHIDRCLSCLSCMTTCPSGVDYMHLIDHARVRIERTYRRPFGDKLVRGLLARTLPYRRRFRLALRMARLARPFVPMLRRFGRAGTRLETMLRLAPESLPAKTSMRPGVSFTPEGERRAGWRFSMAVRRLSLIPGSTLRQSGFSAASASRWCSRVEKDVAARSSTTWGASARRAGSRAPTSTHGSTRSTARGSTRSSPPRRAAARPSRTMPTFFSRDRVYARKGGTRRRARARRQRISRTAGSPASQAWERPDRRLPFRLLAAARAADHRVAQGAAQERRFRGPRHPRKPRLLRLGRHLQHTAAGDRRAAPRPQGAQHRVGRAGRDSHREHRLHHPDRVGHHRAGACTPSNSSTGPTATARRTFSVAARAHRRSETARRAPA